MDEERISRLLRELPRYEASAWFTAGVVRRLDEKPRRRGGAIRRLAFAAATVLTVAAGLFVAHEHAQERERQQALYRLEALEARKLELERELRSLRRLARDAQPVVYLGSTPSVDVVVDLGRLAPARFASSPTEGDYRR